MSPNAYYNHRKHRRDAAEKKKASLKKQIEKIYHGCEGKTGYRMMHRILANMGCQASVQTAREYMNGELGLKSLTRRRRRHWHARGPAPHAVYENVINRNFNAGGRNQKWCIDFTCIYFGRGRKRYNCSIIDLYDRRAAASVNGKTIDAGLAIETLKKAIERSGGVAPAVLHSDRGSQFTSKKFAGFCKECGITQSMSRPGCPYDNSPMERYFNTLKAELLSLHRYQDEDSLFSAINCYAYGWYNNVRPHSFNGGSPPAKVN